jgi:hypothetical protein
MKSASFILTVVCCLSLNPMRSLAGEPPIRLAVDLTDGSRVIGESRNEAVRIKTEDFRRHVDASGGDVRRADPDALRQRREGGLRHFSELWRPDSTRPFAAADRLGPRRLRLVWQDRRSHALQSRLVRRRSQPSLSTVEGRLNEIGESARRTVPGRPPHNL